MNKLFETITLEGSNVPAEIDAYLHHLTFGYDGVFLFGKALEAEIVSNNLIKIKDGLIINQGRFARIVPGSYEEITIENGVSGVSRTDLIVAHFDTDGLNEIHDIRVIKGEEGGEEPAVTTGDTFTGATINELPLYAVHIEGINVVSVEKKFNYILSVKDLSDAVIAIAEDSPLWLSENAKEKLIALNPNRKE